MNPLPTLVKLARDVTRPIFPQKVAFWKGNPLISGKSRVVKFYNLARPTEIRFMIEILRIPSQRTSFRLAFVAHVFHSPHL